jgi:hypothetical protein
LKGKQRGKGERIAVVLAGEQDLRGLASLDVCLIFCEETPPEARNERNKLVEKRGKLPFYISKEANKRKSLFKTIVTFQQISQRHLQEASTLTIARAVEFAILNVHSPSHRMRQQFHRNIS